jgi:plastocyanin
MNTNKQIIIMVALVFISVLATGAYTMWDPERADEAKGTQVEKTVTYGAYLFSQNCRTCHGNKGEGGSASNRLKLAPALNRCDLQGYKAASPGAACDKTTFSATDKATQFKFIVNTITCGRVGKAMPTWGQSQGGTLNDEQIRQLATLIAEGTGWDKADEFAIDGVPAFQKHGDDSDGLALAAQFDASSDRVQLNKADIAGKGDRLQIEDEILVVTASNKGFATVTVERGVGTTSPKTHAQGTRVLKVPVPPDPPAITQPACGQNLPAASATTAPEAPSATLKITALGIAWDKDALAAIEGVPLTITVDNKDNAIPHNIAFFKGEDDTGEKMVATDITPGPVVQTLSFGPLAAGKYYYKCEVHPQMSGILTAGPAGAAAAATTPAAADAAATPAAAATP